MATVAFFVAIAALIVSIVSLITRQGDRGAQGPKGDTGPMGPKGDKGDPGVLDRTYLVNELQNLKNYCDETFSKKRKKKEEANEK